MSGTNQVARIAANAMSGAGVRIAMMAIGFGLTPFIVQSLGLPVFGLWAIVGAMAGYLGLLDFGIAGGFVKFIGEYVEQGRKDAARQVITFGMLFYAGFGLVLALPVYLFTPALVHLFKMPPDQIGTAIQVFETLFCLLVVSMILGVSGAVVTAMHRMDLASRNNFIGYLAYALATVAFLKLGWGVRGIIGSQIVWMATSGFLQYITARRLFGHLLISPARFDKAILGRVLRFGGWTQANSILTILNLDVGRFISASIISVSSTAYYEIGSKVSFLSRSLPAYLLDAILPTAAAADARRDDASLARIYRAGTVYSVLATFGLAGFLIAVSDPLLRIWFGHVYPYVSGVILWLAIGYAISGMTCVGTTIFRAMGMPQYETAFTAVSAVGNLIATVLIAPHLGIVGVALGTAIGWTVGTIYFLVVFHRARQLPWWTSVGGSTFRMACAAAAVTALLSAALHTNVAAHLFESRILGLIWLGVAGVVYGAVYLLLAWVLGAFRSDDALIARSITALREAIGVRIPSPNRRAA